MEARHLADHVQLLLQLAHDEEVVLHLGQPRVDEDGVVDRARLPGHGLGDATYARNRLVLNLKTYSAS